VLGLANTLPKFGRTIIISHQGTAHVKHLSPHPPSHPPSHPTTPHLHTKKSAYLFVEKAKGNICFCNHMHTQKCIPFVEKAKANICFCNHMHTSITLMTKHDLVGRLLFSYYSHQHPTPIYTFPTQPNSTQPNPTQPSCFNFFIHGLKFSEEVCIDV
jgi:hypothetical protein